MVAEPSVDDPWAMMLPQLSLTNADEWLGIVKEEPINFQEVKSGGEEIDMLFAELTAVRDRARQALSAKSVAGVIVSLFIAMEAMLSLMAKVTTATIVALRRNDTKFNELDKLRPEVSSLQEEMKTTVRSQEMQDIVRRIELMELKVENKKGERRDKVIESKVLIGLPQLSNGKDVSFRLLYDKLSNCFAMHYKAAKGGLPVILKDVSRNEKARG